MVKRVTDKYVPSQIPETLPGLVQFFYDELPRIAAAINEAPSAVNVNQSVAGVPITTVPTEFRLFEGELPKNDLPGGGWDSVAGEWTILVSGFYQVNLVANITPFGSGNKDYAASLNLYKNNGLLFTTGNVGDDAFDLGTAMAMSIDLLREDVIRTTITLVHDQFVGNTTVQSAFGVVEVNAQ